MRILEKDIQDTINRIVGFFRRAALDAETIQYHEILQARHLDQGRFATSPLRRRAGAHQ